MELSPLRTVCFLTQENTMKVTIRKFVLPFGALTCWKKNIGVYYYYYYSQLHNLVRTQQ